MIQIIYENHRYTHSIHGFYDSVSTLKKGVQKPFDSKYWSEYKALERLLPDFKILKGKKPAPDLAKLRSYVHPDELQRTIQDILVQWSAEATVGKSRGTSYHDMKEQRDKREGHAVCHMDRQKYPIRDPHELTFEYKRSLLTSLKDVERSVCYPELMIWSDKYKYAGTIDNLFVLKDGRLYFWDYKTDKRFRTENRWSKLLAPISHLDDCELNVYALQLSLYALPFVDLGFEIAELEIMHNHFGLETVYTLPILIEEARAVAKANYFSKHNTFI